MSPESPDSSKDRDKVADERENNLPTSSAIADCGSEIDYRQRVLDACRLLKYATERGVKVSDEVTTAILSASSGLGGRSEDSTPRAGCTDPRTAKLVKFYSAYQVLAELVWPVTAKGLWNTSREKPDGSFVRRSEAECWSLILWATTGVVIAVILAAELYTALIETLDPVDLLTERDLFSESSVSAGVLHRLAMLIQPFAYGALGACAYLLRSCHTQIRKRTFDELRKHEYVNRILLGVVAGAAAAFLLADFIAEGSEVQVGSAALAFLAGYNTDFLFTTLERLVAAVLPKVAPQQVETVSQPEPPEPAAKSGKG